MRPVRGAGKVARLIGPARGFKHTSSLYSRVWRRRWAGQLASVRSHAPTRPPLQLRESASAPQVRAQRRAVSCCGSGVLLVRHSCASRYVGVGVPAACSRRCGRRRLGCVQDGAAACQCRHNLHPAKASTNPWPLAPQQQARPRRRPAQAMPAPVGAATGATERRAAAAALPKKVDRRLPRPETQAVALVAPAVAVVVPVGQRVHPGEGFEAVPALDHEPFPQTPHEELRP